MTGIEAARALGALAGDCERHMEVLSAVSLAGLDATVAFLKEERCRVELLDSAISLHFIIELTRGNDTVTVEVRYSHTNIVRITKNDAVLFVTYMVGGTLTQIKDTVSNTLADTPGIICDGAKASCAAKISSALDAAMFGHALAMKGKVYASNTGILQEDTGETISCVGHIGRVGM